MEQCYKILHLLTHSRAQLEKIAEYTKFENEEYILRFYIRDCQIIVLGSFLQKICIKYIINKR